MAIHQSFPESIWHPAIPGLQVVWDATSLSMLSACARKYQLQQIEGWSPKGDRIDLLFGVAFGEAMETFYKAIVEEGATHAEAQKRALHCALRHAWTEPGHPQTFGAFEPVWSCAGDVPFKNAKGNKAKCPYSHAGKLFPGEGPAVCSCGGTILRRSEWLAPNPMKDRLQLLRLVYFYTEHEKETHFPITGLSLTDPDGKQRQIALAEVPWMVDGQSFGGLSFYYAGWFDKIISQKDGPAYISDLKTTKHALGAHYFSQYAPNMQVQLYGAVGRLMMPALGIQGVVIEAFQLVTGGVRYAQRVFDLTADQVDEFKVDLEYLLIKAMLYHKQGYYPRNPSACFLCPFKQVCAAPEAARIPLLKAGFERSRWNPLLRQKETLPPLPEATIIPFSKESPACPSTPNSAPASPPLSSGSASSNPPSPLV